jgi:hypothetical protein
MLPQLKSDIRKWSKEKLVIEQQDHISRSDQKKINEYQERIDQAFYYINNMASGISLIQEQMKRSEP